MSARNSATAKRGQIRRIAFVRKEREIIPGLSGKGVPDRPMVKADDGERALGYRSTTLSLFYVTLRYRREVFPLTQALARRLREVLPADQYEVKTGGLALIVRSRDGRRSASSAPATMLATPGPRDAKLRRVLEVTADMVQSFIAPNAVPAVSVTATKLAISWRGLLAPGVTVSLREIKRDEIGL